MAPSALVSIASARGRARRATRKLLQTSDELALSDDTREGTDVLLAHFLLEAPPTP